MRQGREFGWEIELQFTVQTPLRLVPHQHRRFPSKCARPLEERLNTVQFVASKHCVAHIEHEPVFPISVHIRPTKPG